MKKTITFLTALCISLAVFAQTDSPSINNLIAKYQELAAQHQKYCNEKDYEQAISQLQQMAAFVDGIKLSDEEREEFPKFINILNTNIYYNLACNYSLTNRTKEALEAFEKAIGFGFSEYRHVKTDSDLDNIRNEEKFVALMDTLKQFDKLVILQSAGKYQQENTDSLPKFTYQSAENRNLQNVKNYFNLDSIAGNGDEISKITNLLFFVTNAIKYDGSNWALCEFDAIDFYNYHKATGKGINCRHMAMTLNEVYLAMGFKSRYVTCMPKDEDDPDCHVINIVYSETLKKWLWLDPSHGIYVMDENNNMLSISEVRERLINNLPLKLNAETGRTKEWYLDYYMAKNLYWLQCANISRFNTESRYRNRDSDLKYVSLLPIGYGENNQYLKNGVITHDSDYFWQAPIFE